MQHRCSPVAAAAWRPAALAAPVVVKPESLVVAGRGNRAAGAIGLPTEEPAEANLPSESRRPSAASQNVKLPNHCWLNIPEHRQAIDKFDTQIVKLLNERTKHVLAIGDIKRKAGEEIYSPHRERAVLQRISRKNQGPVTNQSLRAIYREIMSSALSLQKSLTVLFTRGDVYPPGRHSPSRQPGYSPQKTITDVFTRSARTARTTAWCRSRTRPRALSRTRSTCLSIAT
jgi:chorismate mutase-like protein